MYETEVHLVKQLITCRCKISQRQEHFKKEYGISSRKGWEILKSLTSSRRTTRKHANYFHATDRRASIHAFRFVCVLREDL